MVANYRLVLLHPGAAQLFATALVARLPQAMSALAILLLVRDATHSYAAAGAAVGAQALATAACAPPVGRLVDRLGPGRVLAPLAAAQAGVYATLVLAAGAGAGATVLIVVSALAGALLPPIAPVFRVRLQDVFAEPAARETAYSLEAVLQEVLWITGPLVVALVIAFTSPRGAVLLLGAVGLSGTTLFVRSPLVRAARARGIHHQRSSALASAGLRALLGPVALMGAGLGATEVGLPSLALHAGSRPASGVLLALWSVGSMAGGPWYGARAWRSPLASRYRLLLVLAVACTAPLIAARSIPAGIVCSLLAGLTIAPAFSCQYALVGRAVTPGSETEAFTWVAAALIGGLAAGSAIGGAVIGPLGVSGPFLIASGATMLAAALAVRVRAPARYLSTK
jgi:MFS family permease